LQISPKLPGATIDGSKLQFRSLVFNYDTLSEEQKSSLAGLLSFAKSIDPDFINALVLKIWFFAGG
jgi:hypothetical protein